jgi:hypothetical protein
LRQCGGRKLRTRGIWWQVASKPTIKNKYREFVSRDWLNKEKRGRRRLKCLKIVV